MRDVGAHVLRRRPRRGQRGTLLAVIGLIAAVAIGGAAAGLAGNAAPAGTVKVLLVGDSVAQTLGMGLSVHANRWHVALTDDALIGCGVTQATPIAYGGVRFPTEPYCQQWPERYRAEVERLRPQVVALLAGRWEVADAEFDGQMRNIFDPLYATYIEEQLALAVRVLSSDGAKVALLTAPYSAPATEPFEPLGTPSCSPGCNRPFPEDDPSRIDRYNAILRVVAEAFPDKATLIDLAARVDPGGHYAEFIDGVQVRDADGIHFTIAGGKWLRPWLLPRLAALAR
jgi:lysophospholipase L1-like esterase